jgi:hypothetical protein
MKALANRAAQAQSPARAVGRAAGVRHADRSEQERMKKLVKERNIQLQD